MVSAAYSPAARWGLRATGAASIILSGCHPVDRSADMWIFEAWPPRAIRHHDHPTLEATLDRESPLDRESFLGPFAKKGFSAKQEQESPAHQERRIELAAAINETMSFQFAVRPGDAALAGPDFRIAPFESGHARIDPSVVTLYRLRPVSLGAFPGWHIRSAGPGERVREPLDVLIPIRAPRGGLPATMRAGKTYPFWVDVAVPKGTTAGTYATEIELLSRGKPVSALTVQLTVWPFVLPDRVDLPVIVELDHRALRRHHASAPRSAGEDALLIRTLRMLQSHRLTPALPELTPLVTMSAAGEVSIDWSQYDAVVQPCMEGSLFGDRLGLSLWPLPLHDVFSAGPTSAAPASPMHAALVRSYLTQCARHFEQMGWLDRSYALPPDDAGVGIEAAGAACGLAEGVRNAEARVPIVSRMFPQDMAPYGWVDYPYRDFDDCVDIWMPPAQFYDIEAMAAQRAAGKRTWLSIDRPPFSGTISVFATPADVFVLTWQARRLGAGALHLGDINRWPGAEQRPTPRHCVRADPNVLLYPGGRFGLAEPVPSVRLKWLRRTLQDAAYCELLASHGLEHITNTLRQSLAPYAGSDAYRTHFADGRPIGWALEPALFDAARNIMAEALMSALDPSDDHTRAGRFARSADWKRFMRKAREVRIHVDGTRVRMTGTRATQAARIECALTIVNGKRAPIAGTVRFVELPEGWSAPDEGQPVATIEPNRSRRVTLVARATVMPIQAGGFFTCPLEFVDDTGQAQTFEARVCYMAAEPTTGPIEIDGDLSDWPPGSTNVAADFVLISGPGTDRAHAKATRPRNETIAVLMRDRDYLYVAVNCETNAGPPPPPAPRRKTVTYDDLIPVGEELIEVLIDPFNTGTRSPSDLYHIVVKRAGSDLMEKGVRFDPPCGTSQPWAVNVEVATRVSAKRWTAELAIPLAALGPQPADHTTWGFTVTRYDAACQEFSTWSGAVRNAYDPLSLGNLYLP